MVNKIKLLKELNEFVNGVEDFSRDELKSLVDKLSDDIFSENHLIRVELPNEDKRSFKEFLISNGFGSEISLSSNLVEDGEGYLVFDPSRVITCEFILSDCIKRRYNIDLKTLPIVSGIRRVVLGQSVKALYNIQFKCSAEYTILGKESRNNRSAVFEVFSELNECFDNSRKFKSFLQLSPSEFIDSIEYQGLVGEISVKESDNKYDLFAPFRIVGKCRIYSDDSLESSIESSLRKFLLSIIGNKKVSLKKLDIKLI